MIENDKKVVNKSKRGKRKTGVLNGNYSASVEAEPIVEPAERVSLDNDLENITSPAPSSIITSVKTEDIAAIKGNEGDEGDEEDEFSIDLSPPTKIEEKKGSMQEKQKGQKRSEPTPKKLPKRKKTSESSDNESLDQVATPRVSEVTQETAQEIKLIDNIPSQARETIDTKRDDISPKVLSIELEESLPKPDLWSDDIQDVQQVSKVIAESKEDPTFQSNSSFKENLENEVKDGAKAEVKAERTGVEADVKPHKTRKKKIATSKGENLTNKNKVNETPEITHTDDVLNNPVIESSEVADTAKKPKEQKKVTTNKPTKKTKQIEVDTPERKIKPLKKVKEQQGDEVKDRKSSAKNTKRSKGAKDTTGEKKAAETIKATEAKKSEHVTNEGVSNTTAEKTAEKTTENNSTTNEVKKGKKSSLFEIPPYIKKVGWKPIVAILILAGLVSTSYFVGYPYMVKVYEWTMGINSSNEPSKEGLLDKKRPPTEEEKKILDKTKGVIETKSQADVTLEVVPEKRVSMATLPIEKRPVGAQNLKKEDKANRLVVITKWPKTPYQFIRVRTKISDIYKSKINPQKRYLKIEDPNNPNAFVTAETSTKALVKLIEDGEIKAGQPATITLSAMNPSSQERYLRERETVSRWFNTSTNHIFSIEEYERTNK
jgi:hypothetical protein